MFLLWDAIIQLGNGISGFLPCQVFSSPAGSVCFFKPERVDLRVFLVAQRYHQFVSDFGLGLRICFALYEFRGKAENDSMEFQAVKPSPPGRGCAEVA